MFTVGHGARSIEAFVATLTDAGVEVLVDIRRFPGSRRHPQYEREALADVLHANGIRYEWQGDPLGGRRRARASTRHTALRNAAFTGYADHMNTPQFRAAINALGARTDVVAVMCAETLWWHCHRMLVADALTMRGATVVHLMGRGERQPHRLHATVRRAEDGWPVYDVPDTLPGL